MYDTIIIGAGIAGLTAAIYAARYRLNTLVIGKEPGGAIVGSYVVENWPGFKSLSGLELMDKVIEQVKGLGVEIKQEEVIDIKKEDNGFLVKTKNNSYETKTLILAQGTERRKLDVKGAKEFEGKGVFYCATCDAPFMRDKITAVIGGSDSAAKTALLLTQFAKKVYIIYRRAKIRAEPINTERCEKNKKIEFIYNANVKEIKGDKFVKSVILDNGKELKVGGLFIEIGSDPKTELAKKLGVKLDKENYIVVNQEQKTSIEGIYAAGDITTNSNKIRQLVCDAGEGAVAATSVYESLKK